MTRPVVSDPMRRWLALPAVLVLAALPACGDGADRAAEDDAPATPTRAERAVEVARLALPTSLSDAAVTELLDGLCGAAGSGDVAGVAARLQAAGIDPGAEATALDALAAGASTYCPDDVDAVLPQVQQALAPTTTLPIDPAGAAGATAAAGSGGAGGAAGATAPASGTAGAASTSGGSGSTATGGSSGGAANGSSGAATAGGGNATGTGNQSSTGLTQGVGSGGATNAAG